VGRHDVDAPLRAAMTPAQVARLFVRQRRPPSPYPSEAAELSAIARGDKPMSLMYVGRDEVAELASVAAERGITLVLAPPDGDDIPAYLVGRGELWRVDAHRELSTKPWSREAEVRQSQLLGYSKRQIADRLHTHHAASSGFGVATLYLDLDPRQLRAIRATKLRSLPRAVFPLVAFRVGADLVPRRGSRRDRVLARVGVDLAFAQRTFRGALPVVRMVAATSHLARHIETKIEIWNGRVWT